MVDRIGPSHNDIIGRQNDQDGLEKAKENSWNLGNQIRDDILANGKCVFVFDNFVSLLIRNKLIRITQRQFKDKKILTGTTDTEIENGNVVKQKLIITLGISNTK